MKQKTYTHRDKDGVRWRFEKGKPISEIADNVAKEVFQPKKNKKVKRTETKPRCPVCGYLFVQDFWKPGERHRCPDCDELITR